MEIILRMLFQIAIASLIGAVFLRFATHTVAKFDLPYGRAYWLVFLVSAISNIAAFVFGSAFGARNPIAIIILTLIFWLFIGAGIFGKMIQTPQSGEIGFGKGMKISCIVVLINGVIILLIVGIIGIALR